MDRRRCGPRKTPDRIGLKADYRWQTHSICKRRTRSNRRSRECGCGPRERKVVDCARQRNDGLRTGQVCQPAPASAQRGAVTSTFAHNGFPTRYSSEAGWLLSMSFRIVPIRASVIPPPGPPTITSGVIFIPSVATSFIISSNAALSAPITSETIL